VPRHAGAGLMGFQTNKRSAVAHPQLIAQESATTELPRLLAFLPWRCGPIVSTDDPSPSKVGYQNGTPYPHSRKRRHDCRSDHATEAGVGPGASGLRLAGRHRPAGAPSRRSFGEMADEPPEKGVENNP
jgi:hypothetical protein